jgi:hypothetical protein
MDKWNNFHKISNHSTKFLIILQPYFCPSANNVTEIFEDKQTLNIYFELLWLQIFTEYLSFIGTVFTMNEKWQHKSQINDIFIFFTIHCVTMSRFKIKSFSILSLHYILWPLWPSSGALKFRGNWCAFCATAVGVFILMFLN